MPNHLTHAELVHRAERWLLNTMKCGFVLTELATRAPETPDAIGWERGSSILVECKVSRADFMADQKKWFRTHPETGMGDRRYYMTPPNLIFEDELPANWGLLYAYPTVIRVIQKAARVEFISKKTALQPPYMVYERILLCSALRRVHFRGDLPKIYEPESLNA